MSKVTAEKQTDKSSAYPQPPATIAGLPSYNSVIRAMLSRETPGNIRDTVIAAWNRAAFCKENARLDEQALSVVCYEASARVLARMLAPASRVGFEPEIATTRFTPSDAEQAWWAANSPQHDYMVVGKVERQAAPARKMTAGTNAEARIRTPTPSERFNPESNPDAYLENYDCSGMPGGHSA